MVLVGVLAFALGLQASCGGVGKAGNASAKQGAVLIVKCQIKDAEVWINSRYSRSAAEFARGLRLKPGSYRIEVRHEGYHSRYFEISLEAKERETLEVELAQRFR